MKSVSISLPSGSQADSSTPDVKRTTATEDEQPLGATSTTTAPGGEEKEWAGSSEGRNNPGFRTAPSTWKSFSAEAVGIHPFSLFLSPGLWSSFFSFGEWEAHSCVCVCGWKPFSNLSHMWFCGVRDCCALSVAFLFGRHNTDTGSHRGMVQGNSDGHWREGNLSFILLQGEAFWRVQGARYEGTPQCVQGMGSPSQDALCSKLLFVVVVALMYCHMQHPTWLEEEEEVSNSLLFVS